MWVLTLAWLGFLPHTKSTSDLIFDHHDISKPIWYHVLDRFSVLSQWASPICLPSETHLLSLAICSIFLVFCLINHMSDVVSFILFDLQDQSFLDLCCFLHLELQSSAFIPRASQSKFNVNQPPATSPIQHLTDLYELSTSTPHGILVDILLSKGLCVS